MQIQRHKEHIHQICLFLCRMETVIWASVYIVCLLEVAKNDFVFHFIWIYDEWKNELLKFLHINPLKCSTEYSSTDHPTFLILIFPPFLQQEICSFISNPTYKSHCIALFSTDQLHISHAVQVPPYTYASGLDCQSLQGIPPPVEAFCGPGEAATSSPVTKTICLQGKCGANTVHFGQHDDVVTLWMSNQELAVERNVDISEELLQGRVGVQE